MIPKKTLTQSEYEKEINKQVTAAKKSNKVERQKRLYDSPKKPGTVTVTSTQFVRNSYVIAEVLDRAKGVCENCRRPAPFLRKDLTPFLEVHHKVPLADGGDDTVDNAIALCPNCHRAAHHAADVTTVVAAVIMDGDKVFIAKRGGSGDEAGKWEFPGGKVKGNESLEKSLRREIKEELGVIVRVKKYIGESLHKIETKTYRIMAYIVGNVKGEVELREHIDSKWVDLYDLKQYDLLPANRVFVDMLIQLKPKKSEQLI